MANVEWASDSESISNDEGTTVTDDPRSLTTDEINNIINGLRFGLKHETPIQENIIHIHREKTRRKLLTIKIKPSKIADLKRIIHQQFYKSVIAPGEAIGVNAAQCIGEPTTQMSTLGTERVLVYSSNGTFYNGEIGAFIDELMENNQHVIHLNNDSDILYFTNENQEEYHILTVNPNNEKCDWKKLSEISRHRANGGMIRVTTKSGRQVVTTLSHSHLQRTAEGKIIPIVGSELNLGDRIPIAYNVPHQECIQTIRIKKDEPLDFEFGWYIGAYLAEGFINGNTIFITNQSKHFEDRCKSICARFHAVYSKKEKENNILGSEKIYASITHVIAHNNGLGKFTKTQFNIGSSKKVIPGWVFFAPIPFIKGLLRGYFDGDGNINSSRQLIRVHSINKILLENISKLLLYFGIFGSLKVENQYSKNPLYNLALLRKFTQKFYQEIGSDFQEKVNAMQEIIDYNNRPNVHSRKEEIDLLPQCGKLISVIARPLNLPGYSRNYKRWEQKAAIGRQTLQNYIDIFEKRTEMLGVEKSTNINLLKQAVNSDIIWDEIVQLDVLDDPQTLVYDFGVNGNHTFSVNAGVFIHNTLNSVAPWEKIFYQTADGDLKLVTIGEWIDSLMEIHADKIKNVPENNTQYLELDEPIWTPSPNDQGVITWEALTAVTKHLPCGDLVRVKTRSGREATVTRSKSLLVWDHDLSRFVEKGGANVVIGDLLPVICDFPEPNVIKTHVNLRDYLSPKEWVYGSELLALYHDWSADNRPKRNGFWCGKDRLANLPYSRSDAAIESARLNCVQEGCVYPKKNITSVKSRIPEQFPLDREFGTIMGLYLAEGWATDTFVGISNNNPSIQKLLEAWCDKYGITHHTVVTRSERFENSKSTDLKMHSVLLARWFKKWIGTGSANKRMPIESFVAPESFIIGLLDGYFAGDGTVNKKDGSLIIGSASEELIIGYGVLCTRLSILGRKAGHQVKKNNIGSKNIKYTHTYAIRNGWAQRWANIIGSCHPDKHNLMQEITLQKNYKNKYSSYWDKQENVILDPIIELEDVPATDWVYDLTIPTTTKFSLWNGLAIEDTFHSAGISAKNVTLGFPRATELFNATHTPANPTCTVYFNRDNKTLKDLHKVTDKIQEAIIDDLLKKTPTDCGWECFDPEEYTYEYWHIAWFKLNASEALGEDEWCLRLRFNVGKLYSHNLTIQEIAKEIKTSYSDVRVIPSPLNLGIVDIIVNCAEINIVGERSKDLDDIEDLYEERRFYMEKIVSPKIRGQQICGVQGITTIYRRKAKSNESFGGLPLKPEIAARLAGSTEEWIIDTDGTNLPAILALPGVDPYRTLSNDVWEIYSMLGIEAARSYLLIEFMNIVNSGGTSINPVHIETLVGKMTYTGSIRAIARFGVETSQYDPIARATFEEVMSQLVTSAIFSECDHLSGISSNIVLGTKIRAGTGIVNVEKIPLKIIPQKNHVQKMPKIRPPTQLQEEDDIITEDI